MPEWHEWTYDADVVNSKNRAVARRGCSYIPNLNGLRIMEKGILGRVRCTVVEALGRSHNVRDAKTLVARCLFKLNEKSHGYVMRK